ncbi:MAG: hypothetical protein NUV91_04845 [Candidatus Omnitrophica bacterium]|nr:hypothetical protein [Candidatus Omnitrophota bacterium]
MGIPHKLTPEVIRLIIQKKSLSPDLSCRKLCEIVEQEFDLRLSKSAINVILKDARLSSPVGRRSDEGRRSFEIPQQKKAQLLHSTEKFLDSSRPLQEIPEKSLPHVVPVKIVIETSPHEPLSESVFGVFGAGDVGSDLGVPCDRAGAIFLKATEWMFRSDVLWVEALAQIFPDLSSSDGRVLGELIALLPVFDFYRPEDVLEYSQNGLWALCDVDPAHGKTIVEKFGSQVFEKKNFEKFYTVFPSRLVEVRYFVLVLEDGTEIYFDAQLFSLASPQSRPASFSPFEKAANFIAQSLIRSQSPMIFCLDQGEESFSLQLQNLVAGCEQIKGKRPIKIQCYDGNEKLLTAFDLIRDQRRFFMIGVYSWQKNLFEKILGGVQNRGKSFLMKAEPLNCQLVCQEVLVSLEDLNQLGLKAFRGVVLEGGASEKSGEAAKRLILTNVPEGMLSSEGVVRSYLKKWMYGQPVESSINDLSDFNKKAYEKTDSGWTMSKMLTHYCQKYFFAGASLDEEDIKTHIYALGGFLKSEKNFLKATLNLDKNRSSSIDLKRAAQILNQNEIHDFQGRRVWVDLKE